jgi:MFS family permease
VETEASNPIVMTAAPPVPRSSRLSVATLFLVNAVLTGTWASRIPAIQTARGLNHAELGVVLFALAFGALIAMPLAGRWAARVGSATVCKATALGCCISLQLAAIAPDPLVLGVVLFCFGGLHGAMDVAMNAQAVAVESAFGRPIMSSFHGIWSTGALAGAALGGVFAGARISIWLHFALVSVCLAGLAVAVGFKHLAAFQQSRIPLSAEATRRKVGIPPLPLLGLGAIAFCIMLGEGAVADWSAIFLRSHAGAGEGFATAGYAASSFAMVAVRFSGDALAQRFGPAALVRTGSALAAAGLAFALAFPNPLAGTIGFGLMGAGLGTIIPQVFSAAGRSVSPAGEPAAALATVTTLGYFGFLVGPPLIGLVAEWNGLRAGLSLVVAACLIALSLGGLVADRRAKGG